MNRLLVVLWFLHLPLTSGVGIAGTYDFKGGAVGAHDLKSKLTMSSTRTVVRRLHTGALDLSGVRASGPLVLEDCVIDTLDLSDTTLASLSIQGGQILQLKLQRASIKGALQITGATVERFDGHFLEAPGDVVVEDTKFTGAFNLEFAALGSWVLRAVSWPASPGGIRLHGLTYRYWLLADSWREQVTLLGRAVRSEQAYVQLEGMFHGQGYRLRGDATFIAWKRRDRADRWHAGGLDNRLAAMGSLALDLLVGHGRETWRVAVWSLILVLVGAILCSNRRRLHPMGSPPPAHHPFALALDWFLPLVDLRVASRWRVDARHTFIWLYLRGLSLAGWVLVPLSVFGALGFLD